MCILDCLLVSATIFYTNKAKIWMGVVTYLQLANLLPIANVCLQHKSTFGVHYRTGSPGQLGLRVAGFPGHWVAGSQNVNQFHVCRTPAHRITPKNGKQHGCLPWVRGFPWGFPWAWVWWLWWIPVCLWGSYGDFRVDVRNALNTW